MHHTKFVLTGSGQLLLFSNIETHADIVQRFRTPATHAGFLAFPDEREGAIEVFGKSTSTGRSSEGAILPAIAEWFGVLLHENTPYESIVFCNDAGLLSKAEVTVHKAAVVGIQDQYHCEVWLPHFAGISVRDLAIFSGRYGPFVGRDEVFFIED